MDTTTSRKTRGMAAATKAALALVDAGVATPHAAAILHEIKPGTIYRALKRRRERQANQLEHINQETR